MLFSMKTGELLKGLRWVYGAVDRKNTSPVLQNLMISTSGKDTVEVTATDLTMVTTGRLSAIVSKPGAIVVNAKKILDVISALPEGDVTLERLENNGVIIRSGKIEFKLLGVRPEEFPRITRPAGLKMFKVRRDVLESMISKTIYAIATEEARRNLSGVCMETMEGGKVRMIATDGHRLSMVESNLASETDVVFSGAIVPRKGVAEIRRILADAGEEVEMGFLQNQVLLNTADVMVSTKLIEGKYPDYMQVLPIGSDRVMTGSRAGIIDALKRISLLSQNNSIVLLKLRKDSMTITSTSPDAGEAREELDVSFNNTPLDVAINARYLIDAFSVMDTETVRIEFKDELSVIKLMPGSEDGYVCVVMPVRQ